MRGSTRAGALCLALAALRGASAPAQPLPLRYFDTADGLAHDRVNAVYEDSHGFLWFGTWEGLSRFDGRAFLNYSTLDGLPAALVWAVTEDRRGRLWIATSDGVARLRDDPGPSRFVALKVGPTRESNTVYGLAFDADGSMWCASAAGLYQGRPSGEEWSFRRVRPQSDFGKLAVLFADRDGGLWYVGKRGFARAAAAGTMGAMPETAAKDEVVDVCQDPGGRIFAAYNYSLWTHPGPLLSGGREGWTRLPAVPGDERYFTSAACDAKGLWLGMSLGLVRYEDGRQTRHTIAQALRDEAGVLSLGYDRAGNLWVASLQGAARMAPHTATRLTRAEGLLHDDVGRVVEARDGRIYAGTARGPVQIAGGRAVPVPVVEEPFKGKGVWNRMLQDARGDWWGGTDRGLFHLPGPDLRLVQGKRLGAGEGIDPGAVYGPLHADAAGRIWFCILHPDASASLYGFDPARPRTLQRVRLENGAVAMLSDRAGVLWVGYHGGLFRLVEGRVVPFARGIDEPRVLFQDSRGWVWIGQRLKGVAVIKDPSDERAALSSYTMREGMASDAVWAICEDGQGRMYFGTARGLEQLDVATGRVRHFSTEQGLPQVVVHHCIRDRRGDLWVGTASGLWRLPPNVESSSTPLPIYIQRVQVAGEDVSLPARGATQIAPLTLSSAQNSLLLEYVAPELRPTRTLAYQHRLEGVDAGWSPPREHRLVNYARLGPGAYRFQVRALAPDGSVSAEPATVPFRILAPFWRRGWFLALAGALLALATGAFHRQRVTRLLELERVRTRIASDLHDDIGANLSRIAMLSEVTLRSANGGDPATRRRLSLMAEVSRDLVDAMSDIVWAVNPTRDRARDLVQRMRRFADDLLGAREVALDFQAPAELEMALGPDVRREVYRIFKETIHNVVRHSGCTRVEVEFQPESDWLRLTVRDDGTGFDPAQAGDGTGLQNMRRRAQGLGGALEVDSEPGRGTRVRLRIPLGREPR